MLKPVLKVTATLVRSNADDATEQHMLKSIKKLKILSVTISFLILIH